MQGGMDGECKGELKCKWVLQVVGNDIKELQVDGRICSWMNSVEVSTRNKWMALLE